MSGQNYRKILSLLLPAGALGMSILLGSAGAQAAHEIGQNSGATEARVAERLAAIRDAVSDIAVPGAEAVPPAQGGEELAWHNWRNGGWRNGGWRNGGWGNGWNNWGNGWKNGWNNWSNGWNNWGGGGGWLNF